MHDHPLIEQHHAVADPFIQIHNLVEHKYLAQDYIDACTLLTGDKPIVGDIIYEYDEECTVMYNITIKTDAGTIFMKKEHEQIYNIFPSIPHVKAEQKFTCEVHLKTGPIITYLTTAKQIERSIDFYTSFQKRPVTDPSDDYIYFANTSNLEVFRDFFSHAHHQNVNFNLAQEGPYWIKVHQHEHQLEFTISPQNAFGSHHKLQINRQKCTSSNGILEAWGSQGQLLNQLDCETPQDPYQSYVKALNDALFSLKVRPPDIHTMQHDMYLKVPNSRAQTNIFNPIVSFNATGPLYPTHESPMPSEYKPISSKSHQCRWLSGHQLKLLNFKVKRMNFSIRCVEISRLLLPEKRKYVFHHASFTDKTCQYSIPMDDGSLVYKEIEEELYYSSMKVNSTPSAVYLVTDVKKVNEKLKTLAGIKKDCFDPKKVHPGVLLEHFLDSNRLEIHYLPIDQSGDQAERMPVATVISPTPYPSDVDIIMKYQYFFCPEYHPGIDQEMYIGSAYYVMDLITGVAEPWHGVSLFEAIGFAFFEKGKVPTGAGLEPPTLVGKWPEGNTKKGDGSGKEAKSGNEEDCNKSGRVVSWVWVIYGLVGILGVAACVLCVRLKRRELTFHEDAYLIEDDF